MTHQSPANRVAAQVRAEMARRRISQTALADRLGMSQSAISRRLSGATPFDVDELEAVARALDVTSATLIAYEEPAPKRRRGAA